MVESGSRKESSLTDRRERAGGKVEEKIWCSLNKELVIVRQK